MGSKCAWAMAMVLGLVATEAPAQISFQQNSYGLAIPPFGGYTPGAGATIGLGTAGNSFFEQNGFAQAVPPFGGFTPDAGATLSFGLPGGSINFSAAQGSRSSLSAQSVTGTLANGAPMSVAESSLTPFVIGAIPVVGQGGTSPLAERVVRLRQGEEPGPRGGGAQPAQVAVQPAAHAPDRPVRNAAAAGGAIAEGPSSAERPARSVAEIRRALQQASAADDASGTATAQELIERAAAASASGKASVARVYYQQALRRATGPLKQQVQQQLDALR